MDFHFIFIARVIGDVSKSIQS